jgi:Arc/MetJ-type ribon-helix-helix transcriptional regulator
MRKPWNASCDHEIIEEAKMVVGNSRGRYSSLSHFLKVAVLALLDKEREGPPPTKKS